MPQEWFTGLIIAGLIVTCLLLAAPAPTAGAASSPAPDATAGAVASPAPDAVPPAASAAGMTGPGHWAAPIAKLLAARDLWSTPPDLDQPIPPGAWNALMAAVTGLPAGPGDPDRDPQRYWLWTYTGGMGEGNSLQRQDAIGGLMKVLNFVYRYDNDSADYRALQRFRDFGKVSDGQAALVASAVAGGVAGGYPSGELRPAAPLTHGEAAALADRVVSRFATPAGAPAPPTAPPGPAGPGSPTGPTAPAPRLPAPAGWGHGLSLPLSFRPDGIVSDGAPGGAAGGMGFVLHGAAWSASLPVVGPAPAGHLWLLVDAEVLNFSTAEPLPISRGLNFGAEDPQQVLFRFDMDAAATAALGSPFVYPAGVLAPGEATRGIVAFAVPTGTKGIWYHLQSGLGRSKGKHGEAGWTAALRGHIGDLPGPERVYPATPERRGGIHREAGTFATLDEAAAITRAARSRGIPGWLESEPGGGYTAIVGFRYFEE